MKVLFQFILCSLCGLTLSTGGLTAQTLVANYSFAGNAQDLSATANAASVNGAFLTQDRFGTANNAFQFDGAQSYLQAVNNVALNSDYTTLAFWIKANEIPASGEVYPISFGGWQERFKISLPPHGKLIWTTNNSSGISDMDAGAGNELVAGAWTHVAFTHDGTNDRIFMNGIMVAEKAVTGTMNLTTRPLGIGYNPVDNSNFFKGALDEVRIYDAALSEQDIADLYQAQSTAPVVPSGMVASYDFSNTLDGTAFGSHAQGTNLAAATDRFGFGKSAMSFNGISSKFTASNSSQLNSDFATLSFWVKANSFPASGEVYLMSFGGWQERWKISMPSHGKPVFTTHAAGACCSDLDSGTPLNIGEWTHVVMSHDGVKDVIYFNGVKVNEKDAAGALDATTHPLGIGYDPIDNGGFFDGVFDEVQLYNTALSAVEISTLYDTQSLFPGTAPDLVASYAFSSNAKDASVYGNDGVVNGVTPTADRFGYGANAMQFSGNGGVWAANSTALNSASATISFWVNVEALPASGEVYLLSNGGWQERWKISMPSHGKPVFTTHAAGNCCSDMDSGTPLNIGEWTHVAMTHDGTKDIIYFNGVQVNEKDVAGALDSTSHPLGIGYDPIDNGGFFQGSLDEVQIYNVALTAPEILALYAAQNTAPVIPGNLIADYTFSGNANDATAYKNDAQVSGAQLGTDRFGKTNQAYAFNGVDDAITAANSPQLNSDFTTLSFWVNVKTIPASGEVYLLSNGGWQERFKVSLPNHGKPVFTTHAGGNCCSDMDSGTSLNIDEWTHVAMTHDGTKDIIYFNGAQVNEKDVTGALDATTHPLGIGYDPIDNGGFFNGSLDEVQLYNVALTAPQIAALYAEQSMEPVGTDFVAPSAPLNLTGTVVFNTITLNWWSSTDNVGVTAYNVFQDGIKVMTTANTTAALAGLTPLTTFTFSVTAVDAEGNESLPTSLKVTSGLDETPDTEAPTMPGNLAASTGASSVLLTWDASTDNVQVAGYVVLVDGIFSDSLGGNASSVFIGGLDAETLYSFEVYAYDPSGNNSEIAEITVSTDQELNTGEPGLVAHYPFDGDANDATPYENHGVIGGDPVFEAVTHLNGTGNLAIVFDGDRDSVLAANAVQLISDYATVSFWIRVDATTTDAEAYILDFGHWSERWKISLPQHNKIVWTTNSKNAVADNFIHDMDSGDGNDLVPTFWWYVTMVHDGENDIIYIDGQQVNSLPAPGTLNSTGLTFGMGNNPVEGGQYFTGALDELKLYNRALTTEEVAELYSGGKLTGLNDHLSSELANVIQTYYPNPTTDQLIIEHSIQNDQPLLLRVFDVAGRQVEAISFKKNELPSERFSVNVKNLATGTYFLNFVLGGKNLGGLKFNKQ